MAFLNSVSFNNEIVVKTCEPHDAHLFLDFAQAIARETTYTLQIVGANIRAEKVHDRWQNAMKDPGQLYLGAFTNDKMVGQIYLERESLTHPWIQHNAKFAMFIVKELWGSGLADFMLKTAVAFLKANGVKRLEATVRSENKRGIAFYKKFGFEVEGVRKQCALIDNLWQDELYIALIL